MKHYRDNLIRTLHKKYPKGARIELISMIDKHTTLKTGDRGTVDFIDDAGNIHMKWDAGSSLSLIPGVDSFKVIEGGEKNARKENS